jgi:tRNA G18 (ribose-2'-O)-methylase SpoU
LKPKTKTSPDLLLSSSKHQQAVAMGDERFSLWDRNVIDRFKSKSNEEIKTELKLTAHPFAVCFENLIHDYNISCGIRSCNAFNCQAVYYFGEKKFDRRGLMGVQNYTPINWLPTLDDFLALKDKYTFVGADNIVGSVPLTTYQYPPNPLIIIGAEDIGLTEFTRSHCKDIVHIPSFGSVRSLNAASALSIFCYDFTSKYRGSK